MKKIYGGYWFEDIGNEINVNIFLGFLAGVFYFGVEIIKEFFILYISIKGISLFLFIYHLAISIILVKKVADVFYKLK
ncbi:MAG: hypothetical protein AABX33_06365 [Nanoarchaeota archaeon]